MTKNRTGDECTRISSSDHRPLLRSRAVAGAVAAVCVVGLALTACSTSTATNAASPTTVASSGAGTGAAGGPSTAGRSSAAGSTPTTTAPTTMAPTTTAPTSAASAAPAADQGEPLAPIGCGAIPVAQANALITAPITEVDYSPKTGGYYPDHHFSCDAGMRIDVYPQDSTSSEDNTDIADENATPTPLPGIADTAVFTQSGLMVNGAGPMPDVYVHKGAATCEIKTSSTVSDYAITASGDLVPGVTPEAAAAWATQAAGLCTDIFTAIKA